MSTLSTNLVTSKRNHPDRIALRLDDLGLMLPNTPAFAIAFFGIMHRGAVAVPMNPLLKAREVEFYLSNSGAKALFGTPTFAEEAKSGAAEVGAQRWIVDDAGLAELIADLSEQDAPVEREDDDVAVILHTSGTTGRTKGATLGDVGRIDEEGYYYIVDRTKDLIIRGGYNVYPREIEEVLYEHPAVAEAAVIGIPHDSLGEDVGAAVALKKGAAVEPDELRDFVKARVAAYKYPRRVWLVDALPKGPTAKILRREISVPTTESER